MGIVTAAPRADAIILEINFERSIGGIHTAVIGWMAGHEAPSKKPKTTREITIAVTPRLAANGMIKVTTLDHNMLCPNTRWPPINSAKRPPGSSVKMYPQKKLPRISCFCPSVQLNLWLASLNGALVVDSKSVVFNVSLPTADVLFVLLEAAGSIISTESEVKLETFLSIFSVSIAYL